MQGPFHRLFGLKGPGFQVSAFTHRSSRFAVGVSEFLTFGSTKHADFQVQDVELTAVLTTWSKTTAKSHRFS